MAETETLLTAYRVAKLCNKVLEAKELDTIREQQVYRYMDQGLIPFVEVEGQRRIKVEDATTWIRKYVAARQVKTTGEDELLAQLLLDEDATAAA